MGDGKGRRGRWKGIEGKNERWMGQKKREKDGGEVAEEMEVRGVG